MAKIVNSWNEWDMLKHVVLGDPTGSALTAPGPDWQYNAASGGMPLGYYGRFPEEQIEAAKEQQEGFKKIMENRGIKVDRVVVPDIIKEQRPVVLPDWTQINLHNVNNPRDAFLPIGNEIMEAPCSRRSRHYEYLCMRPLFEQWFKQDPEFIWSAAPKPRLTDESYVNGYYYDFAFVWDEATRKEKMLKSEYHLTEKEPMWDAADATRLGKDIIWQHSCVSNKAGIEWITRYLAQKGIRVHSVAFDSTKANYWRPWHIDVVVIPVRPGLVMFCPDKEPITPGFVEFFRKNDWEIVPAVRPSYDWNDELTMSAPYHGKGIHGPNWIGMNTLSLSPKEICVFEYEKDYQAQLDKLGFEVIPVAYDKVYKFGGMLHCNTLDIYREGKCEDYFPNQ